MTEQLTLVYPERFLRRACQNGAFVSPSISLFRLSTADSQLFSSNSLSFTLLSKNASANHLVSHSCKNKGLKVPCFHTLTKKGVGEGVLSTSNILTSNLRSLLTPLDSALTLKRAAKSFTSNTYEKHTQGEGSLVAQASACVCRRSVCPGFPVRITKRRFPVAFNFHPSTVDCRLSGADAGTNRFASAKLSYQLQLR